MTLLIARRIFNKFFSRCALLLMIAASLGCQKKEGMVITTKKPEQGIRKLNVLNPGFFTHQITNSKIFIAGSDGEIIVGDIEDQQWQAATTPDFSDKITSLSVDTTGTKLLVVGEHGLIARSEDSGLNWHKLPSPTMKTLNALTFDSKHQHWVAAGEQGLILFSDLTGNHWQQAPFNSVSTISKIIALQTQLIAIGENGLIAQSTDGGRNWAIIPPVSTVEFTDLVIAEQQVFISGADGNLVRGNLETNSWELISTGFSTYLSRIFYNSPKKLFICLGSDGDILLSDDGGNLWAPVSQQNKYLNNIALSNDGKFLLAVGDQGQVLMSNNAGRTWIAQQSPTNTNIEGIIAVGENGFIAYGESGLLMRLKQAQSEWEMINFPVAEFIHQLLPETENNWIAVGAKGAILHSVNQGRHWQPAATPAQENDYFLSIVADNKSGNVITSGPPGTILVKKKNTAEWQVRLALSDASQGYFHRMVTNNTGTIVAIAGPGITHYSLDGGENWSPANIDNSKQLFAAIYDQYRQQFIAVGQEGNIQLSADGKHWVSVTTNIPHSLQTVYATKQKLWAAGDKGILIQSTDGGKTWQDTYASSNATILALFETQHGSLIATGAQGLIAHRGTGDSDNEQHWQPIPSPTQSSLRTPVQDKSTGFIYAAGKTGEIIYSKDDGLSWALLSPVTQGSLKFLYIDNPNKMLIGVGERLIRIPLLTAE